MLVSAGSLVFTPANWNIPQTITVLGLDDPDDDGDALVPIAFGPALGLDPTWEEGPAWTGRIVQNPLQPSYPSCCRLEFP